jgi:acyl carrier protein
MAPEAVIARIFGVPRSTVSDTSSSATVAGWDSLNHVMLILELEKTFGVSFTAEEALSMTDVGTIKHVLASHGAEWDGA